MIALGNALGACVEKEYQALKEPNKIIPPAQF
jgi:hypothetical protein